MRASRRGKDRGHWLPLGSVRGRGWPCAAVVFASKADGWRITCVMAGRQHGPCCSVLRSTMIRCWGDLSVLCADKSPQEGILVLGGLLGRPEVPAPAAVCRAPGGSWRAVAHAGPGAGQAVAGLWMVWWRSGGQVVGRGG
jgi:hypothetical protein